MGAVEPNAVDTAGLLRPGLLQDVSLLLAGPPGAELGEAVGTAFMQLGARVSRCVPDGEDEAASDRAVAEAGAVDVLAVDGAGLFAAGGLRGCLDAAWNVTRAVVNHAFLPAGRGGRIVYLTPAPDAGEHAQAARAGLENLARTLSIEWARHGINTIAIAWDGREPEGAAALAAYLASPAGEYFSGAMLELGAVAG